MSLVPGDRLGPYEIQAAIGRGGMGEVYRARDTRLGRDVAIKISNQQFNERFDREARTISSLNHPNVCALYDVGPDYLVMEYVDGESPRGPMAVDDALKIAMQIAEGLRAAHDRGIVHRDLKPANLKITPDGMVKVLDFGLAKGMDPASGSDLRASAGQLTDSPTITSPMTHAGMILGTAAYMAPEQARGKSVDSRADIWAFGVVLYELITGERPFKGDDLTETLAAVVKDPPNLNAVPARVRPLLDACLQKDPKRRLQSIGDVGLLLGTEPSAAAVHSTPTSRFGRGVTLAASAVALVASAGLAVLALVHFRESQPVQRALRLSIPIPEGGAVGFIELSPDGTRLLVAMAMKGSMQLYVRSLDSDDLQPLAGTTNARTPFWSADSRFIGFFADGKLKTIPAGGGPVRELCDEAGLGSGGSWSRDGVILWAGGARYIRRVAANGGECRPLGARDPNYAAAFPTFHPDGNHFFYFGGKSQDPASNGVYLATLDEPVGRRVLEDQSSVVYAAPVVSGGLAHLLFLRQGRLMAQPFDDGRMQVIGDPFPVVTGASFTLYPPLVAASASADGTLVYLSGRSRDTQLTWFDRTGRALGTVGPEGNNTAVLLSPDATMVATARQEPNDTLALWVHNIVRGSSNRLTPAGTTSGIALWSPDSRRILYAATTAGQTAVYLKDFVTGQQEQIAKLEGPDQKTPTDWSRDGRHIIYSVADPKTRFDIWYAPVASGKIDDSAAVKLVATEAVEGQGQLSPDGKWLAYAVAESATPEVYVRPFPPAASARVWKVSIAGGAEPRWRADGKELYFAKLEGARISLWTAPVQLSAGDELRTGTPQKLFEVPASLYIIQNSIWSYSPSPDGTRFLVNTLTHTTPQTLNVVTNWPSASRPMTARTPVGSR